MRLIRLSLIFLRGCKSFGIGRCEKRDGTDQVSREIWLDTEKIDASHITPEQAAEKIINMNLIKTRI